MKSLNLGTGNNRVNTLKSIAPIILWSIVQIAQSNSVSQLLSILVLKIDFFVELLF